MKKLLIILYFIGYIITAPSFFDSLLNMQKAAEKRELKDDIKNIKKQLESTNKGIQLKVFHSCDNISYRNSCPTEGINNIVNQVNNFLAQNKTIIYAGFALNDNTDVIINYAYLYYIN